jgi:hypothetical protein
MSKRYSPNTPDMTQPNNTRARVRTEIDTRRVEYGRVKAIVRDRNGNIIKKVDQKVDSLLTHFWQLQYNIHSGFSGAFTENSLAGSGRGVVAREQNSNGGLESFAGIVVGSSAAAVTYGQEQMGTLITHGVGSGQLSAEATSNYYDPANNTVEIVRTFVNADTDAADITVRECGICYAASGLTTASTASVSLYCRDVFDSALVIPFEGVLTVVYTITFANGNANYTRILNAMGYRSRADNGLILTNIVNVTGTSFSGTPTAADRYDFLAIEGDDNNGLVLGTSNTNPTALNTWALESKVAHGTGSGQLFYYQSTITSFEENTVTNSCRWYLNRVVQNRSGGSIAVNEIGLFCNITLGTNAVFMVDRKFPDEGGVTITNGQFATFSWEFCYIL